MPDLEEAERIDAAIAEATAALEAELEQTNAAWRGASSRCEELEHQIADARAAVKTLRESIIASPALWRDYRSIERALEETADIEAPKPAPPRLSAGTCLQHGKWFDPVDQCPVCTRDQITWPANHKFPQWVEMDAKQHSDYVQIDYPVGAPHACFGIFFNEEVDMFFPCLRHYTGPVRVAIEPVPEARRDD